MPPRSRPSARRRCRPGCSTGSRRSSPGRTPHDRDAGAAASPDPRDVSGVAAVHRRTVRSTGPGSSRSSHARSTAGLVPAVNMDTGYVQLLDADTRARACGPRRPSAALPGSWPAHSWPTSPAPRSTSTPTPARWTRSAHRGHARDLPVARSQRAGRRMNGSARTKRSVVASTGSSGSSSVRCSCRTAGSTPSPRTKGCSACESCIGAKHSSLSRAAEWDRLEVRDRVRPDFHVFTGNDLAIDMVCYGSDYLLGLSAFAPEAFAERDRRWEHGERSFHELNDLLQYLGAFAFRAPVPAYRHDAALFLQHPRPHRVGHDTARRTPTSRQRPRGPRRHRAALGLVAVTGDEIVQVKRLRTLDELRGAARGARHRRPTRCRRRGGSAGTAVHALLVRRRLDRRAHRGQSVRGAAHGRMGRRARRTTLGPRAPPLAPLRRERSEARLGWRSRRRAARRARQPAPARPRPHDRRRPRGAARRSRRRPRRGRRERRRPGRRPPAHALRALVPADRRVAATDRIPPSRARPAGGSRGDRRALGRRPRRARRDLRRRGRARRGRGLRLRRREALPRVPAPRAARRDRSTGRLRRVVRAPDRRSSDAWSIASGRVSRTSAVGVRLSAYDFVPYEADEDGVGAPVPEAAEVARYAFGGDASGSRHRSRRDPPLPRAVQ